MGGWGLLGWVIGGVEGLGTGGSVPFLGGGVIWG